jgi:LytS/YehU family sensor histidine kinase
MTRETAAPLAWAQVLPVHLVGSWLWIPLSVGLFALVRRFPVERTQWLRALAILSIGVVAVIIVRGAFVLTVNPLTHWWYAAQPTLWQCFIDSARNNLVLAWLVIGVAHAFHYFEREQTGRVTIARLQTEVTQSRLDALTAQLHPHFLFNALNSIAEMLHHDQERADRMLLGLSALLRHSLDRDGAQEITLRDELTLLNQYVDIEKVRLGERFAFHSDVDPDCLDCYVPVLLLQPIVENSVIHNIAKRECPGAVRLHIERSGKATLRVQIDDDGPGPPAELTRVGIGLGNTETRLRSLYGEHGMISISANELAGTRVMITLPYRLAPALRRDAGAAATTLFGQS